MQHSIGSNQGQFWQQQNSSYLTFLQESDHGNFNNFEHSNLNIFNNGTFLYNLLAPVYNRPAPFVTSTGP